MSLKWTIKEGCFSENKYLMLRWLPVQNINTKLYYSALPVCFVVYGSLGTYLWILLYVEEYKNWAAEHF